MTSQSEAFEDLLLVDSINPQRTVFVVYMPHRKKLKWSVWEDHLRSGPLNISNHGGLARAAYRAFKEANWLPCG